MSIDRSKRTTFDQVADLYDETASTYPEELIDDILSLSGIRGQARILEIGCGSGNATISFAQRGHPILAIELGERLAALAARRCQAYPEVRVLNMAFEDWSVEENAFDIVTAADALHWIPPHIAYPTAAKALKATGHAAFFWRVPIDPATDWSRAIDQVYLEVAPGFANPNKRFTAEWMVDIITTNFQASGCFGQVTTRQYFWPETITTEKFIKGLRTFSMHKDMDDETRRRLYAALETVLDQYGGKIEQPNSVMLFHAKVKK